MAFAVNEELDFGVNKLILGDNLEILKTFSDDCIDQSVQAVIVTEFRLEKQYGALEDKEVVQKLKFPNNSIIAFSFGKGAVEEAARLKNAEEIIIKLVCVHEIVPLSVKPAVAVHINEWEKLEDGSRKIEFIAVGDSLSGIEFYSWDFNFNTEKNKFKPSVIMDKEGKQIVVLKTGTHNVAVKVVDNDGLENIEVVKIKINGELKRE